MFVVYRCCLTPEIKIVTFRNLSTIRICFVLTCINLIYIKCDDSKLGFEMHNYVKHISKKILMV